jgi:hypothetical protein
VLGIVLASLWFKFVSLQLNLASRVEMKCLFHLQNWDTLSIFLDGCCMLSFLHLLCINH